MRQKDSITIALFNVLLCKIGLHPNPKIKAKSCRWFKVDTMKNLAAENTKYYQILLKSNKNQ